MNNQVTEPIWRSTEEAARILRVPGKQVVVLIHVNPDGDALGAALALKRLLTGIGHRVSVIAPNDFPDFLRWMPGANEVVRLQDKAEEGKALLSTAEVIFVLDCNELSRIRELNESFSTSDAYKILIDHHPNPELNVDCTVWDTSASSTCELVFLFLQQTDFLEYVDRGVAECLFAGIMTDTGCFSYNSSQRRTYETVATLLDYGIDKDIIYSRVYDNFSSHRMRLLGFSLNERMEILQDYRTAILYLSRGDLMRFHFRPGDTEGFVNYPLSIRGIRFSVLFMEKKDHIKISFRSRGNFPVNEFARKYFSGGGHLNASGGESSDSLAGAVDYFKSLLPEYKDQLADHAE